MKALEGLLSSNFRAICGQQIKNKLLELRMVEGRDPSFNVPDTSISINYDYSNYQAKPMYGGPEDLGEIASFGSCYNGFFQRKVDHKIREYRVIGSK